MDGTISRDVRVYPDLESLSQAAAEVIVRLVDSAIATRGYCAIALSGGETPRALYRLLAERHQGRIPWPQVHFFWGDERCVPPDHPDSNYATAFETLLSNVPVPAQNVHRVPAEIEPPDQAANVYEQTLREFFRPSMRGEPTFTFDLVLLGVGEDGHTASLFPGDPILEEQERWVAAVQASPSARPRWRITLTLPAINNAKQALFLVAGAEKRSVLRSIFGDVEIAAKRYPAAMIHPREGDDLWLIDQAAAPKGG